MLLQVHRRARDYPQDLRSCRLLLPRLRELTPKIVHRLITTDCRHFGWHEGTQPIGYSPKVLSAADESGKPSYARAFVRAMQGVDAGMSVFGRFTRPAASIMNFSNWHSRESRRLRRDHARNLRYFGHNSEGIRWR
jgi:hypothetical protein